MRWLSSEGEKERRRGEEKRRRGEEKRRRGEEKRRRGEEKRRGMVVVVINVDECLQLHAYL